jgi:selenocysteine-specific elongation factor
VDRVFTIKGRGTVVTGTLWSGTIAQGDSLELIPRQALVRVRGIEIHGGSTACAHAGQRVAVNLAAVATDEISRGDVLATPGEFRETSVLDCRLELSRSIGRRERVQVLHGTRSATGRMIGLGDAFWQLRLERPIVAADGDRLVIRRLAPPDTIGGGAVVEALPPRHGPKPEVAERLRSLREGSEPPVAITASVNVAALAKATAPLADPVAASDLEQRLREAASGLLSEAQVGSPAALRALRAAGIAVRVSGRLYGHAATVAVIRGRIVALIEAEGPVTLAAARDALGLSRKVTQAFLEHLDSEHVTRRLPDDTRVLRARAQSYTQSAR